MNFDFELILFYAIIVAGILAFFDIIYFAPRRKHKALKTGQVINMPIVFEYARSFFPILLIVFLVRSFLFEPFRIPSSSLEPTLLSGDFILVNKFAYGLKWPISHKTFFSMGELKRGDIVIFRWPPNPSYHFIKRLVGLPGDHINYINKELFINGQKITQKPIDQELLDMETGYFMPAIKKREDLMGKDHLIYIIPDKTSHDYYDIVVPEGMYFMMGDNRDDSADSRYWGFVPRDNIVGKGLLVWMSFNTEKYNFRWDRIAKIIH